MCDLQIRDINELSRQDVDAIIKMCDCQEYVAPSDNIHKRLVKFFLSLAHQCHNAKTEVIHVELFQSFSDHRSWKCY